MRRLLPLLALLAACGGAPPPSPASVVEAFAAAGLAASNVTTADVLPAPIAGALSTCQGARFEVEAGKGGRVVVCGDAGHAEALERYYRDLGANPMFASHVERRGALVLQMNGELPAETFAAYVGALP